MGKIYLGDGVDKEIKSFGSCVTNLEGFQRVFTNSSLRNAVEFAQITTDLIGVLMSYRALIWGDAERIAAYVDGIRTADNS